MSDLLTYWPEKATVKGGEIKGPCPWCGGEDRCMIQEEPSAVGGHWYKCFGRKAGRKGCGRSGDLLTFLQEYRGLTFAEACEEVGLDPDTMTRDSSERAEPTTEDHEALRERTERKRHLRREEARETASEEEWRAVMLMGEPPLRVKRARRRVRSFLLSAYRKRKGGDNSGDNTVFGPQGIAGLASIVEGLTPAERRKYRRLSREAQWRPDEKEEVREKVSATIGALT